MENLEIQCCDTEVRSGCCKFQSLRSEKPEAPIHRKEKVVIPDQGKRERIVLAFTCLLSLTLQRLNDASPC